ncbi:MAG: peptidyl-tRNA hydrolase [Fibrobacteres bacterium]|nr:peptidyl-tRNA hydrolase [Fibrobacterota bacterium]
MHILLGLGNPGPKYDRTRHNIGFDFADQVAADSGQAGTWKTEAKSLTRKVTVAGLSLLIAKPQTFMNLSGEAAQVLLQFYKVNPRNLIVVVDDIYLDLGAVRIRTQGSHGGHNGLRNIMEHCGDAFTRLRIGVGPVPPEHDKADFVLRKYGTEEASVLDKVLSQAKPIIETGLSLGWERAGSDFNRRGGPKDAGA